MKKITTLLTAILLTVNVFAVNVWDGASEPWTNGDGSNNNPYLIETAANLAYLAEKVNEGYQAEGLEVFAHKYFLLTDDLDLNNINWTPIGNVNYINGTLEGFYFAGNFDGWYHNIDNLKIQSNESLAGLFACLGGYVSAPGGGSGGGTICHLSVTNGDITSSGFGAGGIVGIISGDAHIYQCSFSGTITISSSEQLSGAGGIVGAAIENSGVSECSFHGDISSTNTSFTGAAIGGGIVGAAINQASIGACYSTGNITSNALIVSVAAGILGVTVEDANISVIDSYNIGTVNGGTKGGIFGMISPINPFKGEAEINVSNCYYLNTCGGNTNYGTSMTSAEMQTEQFKNQIDMSAHKFVMDNGTNNGYPIHALSGFRLYDAKDITAHSATFSADLHPGNTSFSNAYFYCTKTDDTGYQEIEIATEGYVEATVENLEESTDYMYSMTVEYTDGGFVGFSPHWFTTQLDGIAEVENTEINFYPNPTSDFLYLNNSEPQLVNIYSIDGRIIKSIENANVVDVRDLNDGLYLININGQTRKFVKGSLAISH